MSLFRRFFLPFVSLILLALPCAAAQKVELVHRKKTLENFPKPPRKMPFSNHPLIVLDPGHGGQDEGAKVSTLIEKKIALTTALLTKKQLELLGYRVILTRSRDVYLSLSRRVMIANRHQGSLFVSIHYNSAKNALAKGIEVFYCAKSEKKRAQASKRLANCLLSHLLDQTEASSRGVKVASHHVTRETEMPAVMVEGGFMTNPEERDLLKKQDYLEKIAKGIAEGIDKYIKS